MKTEFIIHDHHAKKAGFHQDLRIKKPNKNSWISFAIPKGIPIKKNNKVVAIRTHDHSDKAAKKTGKWDDGYGAGTMTYIDSGECIIHRNIDTHIGIELKGKIYKGFYHLVKKSNKSKSKKDQYLIFKGNLK